MRILTTFRQVRLALASAVLFVVALLWNGVVQLVVLREANQAARRLWRPDVNDRMWLSLILTAAVVTVFVVGYTRWSRRGTVREALTYGLFVAALAGLLVDLNQYLLYPIPGSLALKWFVSGLLEFSLYSFLLVWLYPIRRWQTAADPPATELAGTPNPSLQRTPPG